MHDPLLRACRNAHSSLCQHTPPSTVYFPKYHANHRVCSFLPFTSASQASRRLHHARAPPPSLPAAACSMTLTASSVWCLFPFLPRCSKFQFTRCYPYFRWGCAPHLHCLPSERAKSDIVEHHEEDQNMQECWHPLLHRLLLDTGRWRLRARAIAAACPSDCSHVFADKLYDQMLLKNQDATASHFR